MIAPRILLPPGTILQNRYRIIRQLGEGGMAAVYLANDSRLGSNVALKESFFSHDHKLRKQFEREAHLLAGLRHSALPKVIDHFIEAERQYLVMEFIDGDDLLAMLEHRGQPFPPGVVFGWAEQLLKALEYLHTRQPPVIHRDIKPQNLKLTEEGQIILLDFGLAKGTPQQMSHLSAGQSIFGYTPHYAPPEQIQGSGTDMRSDLYSLAATIYHLITAMKPHNALERIMAVATGQVDPLQSPSKVNVEVPGSFATVLLQAMALNKEQRHLNATDMLKELLNTGRSFTAVSKSQTTVNQPSIAETQINEKPAIQKILPVFSYFDFDVVSVDAKGKVISKSKKKARYFIEQLPGGVVLEMVEIPHGTLLMGSPKTEHGRFADEGPQHKVTISPFYMSKYPITQAQWRIIASLPKAGLELVSEPTKFKGDKLPVEQVTWEEAIEFCKRLSSLTGKRFELPTEAQWEYACRGGTTTPFYFGPTITPELANYNGAYPYGEMPKGASRDQTSPVGSIGYANNFGLYDMHGNVQEWCKDHWYRYYSEGSNATSVNKKEDNKDLYVMRGGSWANSAYYCRSAFRNEVTPGFRYDSVGFRLVCTLS